MCSARQRYIHLRARWVRYVFSAGGTATRRCVTVLAPHVTMHGHATARDRATRQSGMTLNTYGDRPRTGSGDPPRTNCPVAAGKRTHAAGQETRRAQTAQLQPENARTRRVRSKTRRGERPTAPRGAVVSGPRRSGGVPLHIEAEKGRRPGSVLRLAAAPGPGVHGLGCASFTRPSLAKRTAFWEAGGRSRFSMANLSPMFAAAARCHRASSVCPATASTSPRW